MFEFKLEIAHESLSERAPATLRLSERAPATLPPGARVAPHASRRSACQAVQPTARKHVETRDPSAVRKLPNPDAEGSDAPSHTE
jgi:hypothetical protein